MHILNINIEKKYSYFTILILYELKNNLLTIIWIYIFYSRDNDILVDNEGNELLNFPMMDGALISFQQDFIYLYECILSIKYDVLYYIKRKEEKWFKFIL